MLIGIINHWPTELTAEAEFTIRLQFCLRSQGIKSFVFDNNGKILKRTEGTESIESIEEADTLLVFDPNLMNCLTDVPVVTPLWVPPTFLNMEQRLEFFRGFHKADVFVGGYESVKLINFYSNIIEKKGRTLGQLRPFYASVPKDFVIQPRRREQGYRLFYAGVNAERISYTNGNQQIVNGRHHNLFCRLDSEDLASFYGPEKFGGIRPWEGFKNYAGMIPLDGKSVIEKISESGVALCLSSIAHLEFDVVTSRLFEALAAGAVIISDGNKFVKTHFGDSVYYVDMSQPEMAFQQIKTIMAEIRNKPEIAFQMALEAHNNFKAD